MTSKQIIDEKLKRLLSVPDAFVNGLPTVEKAFNKAVLTFISQLEQDNTGKIIVNKKNIALLASIENELKNSFLQTDYVNLVNNFIQEFNQQAKLSNDYFKKAFDNPKIPAIAADVLQSKKAAALNLLLSDTAIEAEFITPVKNVIELAITSGASFTETLNAVQDIVTGTPELDSKILSYSKQVTYDSFAITDAAYSQVVSDSIGAEWFFYSGDIIPTSREFCIERHDKYYHKKEIEAWGNGEKTTGLKLPNSNGEWAGEMPGTNAQTIFQTRGGYFCSHFIVPVSIFIVPKDVIQRVISQGFYQPSKFEIQEIGL